MAKNRGGVGKTADRYPERVVTVSKDRLSNLNWEKKCIFALLVMKLGAL